MTASIPILIVGDNISNTVAGVSLTSKGYDVRTAANGRSPRDARRVSSSLILMDIDLPGMDGLA